MNKRLIPFIAIAALLGSCGENENTSSNTDGGKSDISEVQKYTVTYPKSSEYTVTGIKEGGYAEGEKVEFSISVTNALKEVEKVTLSGATLVPNEGKYSFTMAAKNVQIAITLKDKEGVKTAVLTADNNTPKVGDTVTFTLKLDNVALTSGVTLTATSGAELVEITDTKVKCLAVGSVTIQATATVDGIDYNKELTLTIQEGVQITSIATLQATEPTFSADADSTATFESQVTVEGRVVNINKNGLFIYDGTGVIAVRDSAKKAVAKEGEYVRVSGVPTRYKKTATDIRWWEFSYSDKTLTVSKIEHAEIPMPSKENFDVAGLKAYTTPSSGTVKYVSFTGKAGISGDHTNIYMDGETTKSISYYSETFKVVDGLNYNFEGFFAELQSGKFLVCYITNVTEAEMDPVNSVSITNGETAEVKAGSTLQLTAAVLPESADPRVAWSSNDETKATVNENGVVTGVAEGTATITATTVGKDATGVAKTATIAITVTKAVEGLSSATFDWANETFKPATSSSTEAVFTVDAATVTLKGSGLKEGTNWANKYAIRVYQDASLEISVTTGSLYSVDVTLDSYTKLKDLTGVGAVTGGTVVKNADLNFTITATAGKVVLNATKQIRVAKIVVNYTAD